MPNVNTTRFKTLNAMGRDPRIERIDVEGRESQGGDGLWAYTNKGWCNGDVGSHIFHESTVASLLAHYRCIRPCVCLECGGAA